ncbi:MAG: peptidase S8, partial [Proteobacteria bacterium]
MIDTGVDYNHPDLQNNILKDKGMNFATTNKADFMDRNGHGTHVSGIIGADTNNSNLGIAGICWKAKIIPIKGLGDNGSAPVDYVINALVYAAGTEAKILNMSLGLPEASNLFREAVNNFLAKPRLLIA